MGILNLREIDTEEVKKPSKINLCEDCLMLSKDNKCLYQDGVICLPMKKYFISKYKEIRVFNNRLYEGIWDNKEN